MKIGLEDVIGNNGVFADGDWIESKDQDLNGDVRLIQLADIGDGVFLNKSSRFMTQERALELGCTFLEPGDVLIARMPDPLGRACVFPGLNQKAVTVVDICIVRPDKHLADPGWLKGKINSKEFRSEINKRITGTTRKRISRGNLSQLKFVLPPILDQIKIATLLKKTEDLIQKRKESINLLDELVRSTFLEMFGDLFDSDAEELRKHIKIQQGFAFKSSDFVADGIPVIKIGTVNKGYFDFKSISFLPDAEHDEKYIARPGDLLMSLTGTAGKEDYGNTCLVPDKYGFYLLNQRVGSIIPINDTVNKVFLHFLFQQRKIKSEIIKYSRGVRQANISNEDIFKIKVKMPSKVRQDKFSKFWKQSDTTKTHLQKSEKELKKLYDSLSKLAFEGDLDLGKINVDHLLPKKTVVKKDEPTEIQVQKKKKQSLKEENTFIEKRKKEVFEIAQAVMDDFQIKEPSKRIVLDKIENQISVVRIHNWILDNFKGYHFNSEILLRFLEKEKKYKPQYTSTKEWRENLKIDRTQEITDIIYDVMNIEDPEILNDKKRLKLEQVFYDGVKENFDLNIRTQDIDLIEKKLPEDRSGIYFKVKP